MVRSEKMKKISVILFMVVSFLLGAVFHSFFFAKTDYLNASSSGEDVKRAISSPNNKDLNAQKTAYQKKDLRESLRNSQADARSRKEIGHGAGMWDGLDPDERLQQEEAEFWGDDIEEDALQAEIFSREEESQFVAEVAPLISEEDADAFELEHREMTQSVAGEDDLQNELVMRQEEESMLW